MTAVEWMMDGALALALPYLAWRAVVSDELHGAVVVFIVFGLLLAVAWARLAAPDVALVEASVGAGLTGALLMSALGWAGDEPPRRRSWLQRLALPSLLFGLGVGLAFVVLALPAQSPGLRGEVLAELDASGASHPVTAVLLDFRGYDTLLEIMVLLVAAVGSVSASRRSAPGERPEAAQPLLAVLVRLLVPGLVLVAAYVLWRGSHAAGGAFQAGTVLAGAAILLILSRTIRAPAPSSGWVRAGLLVGPGVFLAVAAAPLAAGGYLLDYPQAWASGLVLAIECSLTVSIALLLTTFFAGVARLDASRADAPRTEGA